MRKKIRLHNKDLKNPENNSIKKLQFFKAWELLSPVFSQHRFRLLAGFAALLIVDALQLTIPYIVKYCIDGLKEKTITTEILLWMGWLILIIAITVVILRFCWRYLIIGFSRILERRLRNKIFSHILKMDSPFFERYSTGDLMAHASNDLAAVQMACGMGMVAAIDALVMSLAATGCMVTINFKLTFFALLPLPMLAIATGFLSSKLHHSFSRVQEKFAGLTEFSRATFQSIGLIKAYNMEQFQTKAFDDKGKSYVKSNMQVARIQGIITPFSALTGSLGMLVVLFLGGRLVILETISIGDFVAFISYLYMLIWPMIAIGWVANLLQRGLTSLGRVEEILSSRSTLPQIPEQGRQTLPAKPTFSFRAANFAYPSTSSFALRNLNLELGPGTHGITGHNGSGKTTLCKLLTRRYCLTSGVLLLNGKDVNELPPALIRSQISYVSQEPQLFSDTIRANIAFGRLEAREEEIHHAAQIAALEDEILTMDDGYDTLIGEQGVNLSGGQKQRLALARALLCDRPILIIDDGLSAIDTATEHQIFLTLQQKNYQTIILVSNRIKLLSLTRQIHLFEDGRLRQSGNHSQLLASSSFYQAMYAKQMQEENDA